MAARGLAGVVDPTKPGEYPIVLSDALLGKPSSKEAFTGITYNHKPAALSSGSSSSTARIRSSTNGVVDLTHDTGDGGDGDGIYGFTGARSTKDGQYVLVFDPSRRVFVLHRLDSMFHMNLTLTPDNTDSAALQEEYPHLEPLRVGPGKAGAAASTADKKSKDKPAPSVRVAAAAKSKTGTPAGSKASTPAAKKKAEKKAPLQPAALPLPVAAASPPLPSPAASKPAAEAAKDTKAKKPARRRLSDDESDSSDDGGLVLEFPEGKAPAPARVSRPRNDFSPAFPIRRFSEFARGEGEEEEEDYGRDGGAGGAGAEQEEDADGEEDEEYEDLLEMDEPDHLKLPSPVNGQGAQQAGLGIGGVMAAGGPEEEEMDEDDMLEAELEKQLMEEDEEMAGEESEDVSEEE